MTIAQDSHKGLSANALKLIAIIAMLIDHIGWIFFDSDSPTGVILHFIGRTTAPIMFYLITVGYRHTRNVYKYIGRLAIFALISFIPFVFFSSVRFDMSWDYQNFSVIFTLLMGVIAVHIRHSIKNPLLAWPLIIIATGLTFTSDWAITGVIIILIFDVYYGNFKHQAFAYVLFTLMDNSSMLRLLWLPFDKMFSFLSGYYNDSPVTDYIYPGMLMQLGLFVPIILLSFYNGKIGKGGKFAKWSFYIFYPLHLVILAGIKQFLWPILFSQNLNLN